MVTGAREYGVFVSFCGGVKGLAPLPELGLEAGQDPAAHFPPGKVRALAPPLLSYPMSMGTQDLPSCVVVRTVLHRRGRRM